MAEASAGSRSAAVAGGGGVALWGPGCRWHGGTSGGVVLRADDAEVGSVVSRII